MNTLLFGVTATDPMTLVGVSLLLAMAALVASMVPAWRAMKTDPVTALRGDYINFDRRQSMHCSSPAGEQQDYAGK